MSPYNIGSDEPAECASTVIVAVCVYAVDKLALCRDASLHLVISIRSHLVTLVVRDFTPYKQPCTKSEDAELAHPASTSSLSRKMEFWEIASVVGYL